MAGQRRAGLTASRRPKMMVRFNSNDMIQRVRPKMSDRQETDVSARTLRVPRGMPAFNSITKFFLTAGVQLGLNGLVTISGRKSGLPRTTPVAIVQFRAQVRYPVGGMSSLPFQLPVPTPKRLHVSKTPVPVQTWTVLSRQFIRSHPEFVSRATPLPS
jgi:hypothetical protein